MPSAMIRRKSRVYGGRVPAGRRAPCRAKYFPVGPVHWMPDCEPYALGARPIV